MRFYWKDHRVRVFEGKVFAVEQRDGIDVVVHGPAATIVPVDATGHVTLVRQDRRPVGGKLLELPAGSLDGDESPLDAARRELHEETGLHGGEWVEAATFYTTPGFCDEKMHLFIATGLDQGDADPQDGEELELVRLPLSDVPSLIEEIEDAKTLVGLLLLVHLRLVPPGAAG
jgi:ADP-ribose pyrophosphatase